MSQLIKQQFSRARQSLFKTLEGVSAEAMDVIPEGFNNNIHWQVGHILSVGEFFLFSNEGKLPANYNDFFGNGSKPKNWTGDVPSVDILLDQLKDQLNRIQEIPDEAFNQELPKPFLGNNTAGELAATGAFHEAMHLGQIQSLKRLVEETQAK